MTAGKTRTQSLSSFIGIGFLYLITMSATTAPTPLYPIYQQQMGFSLFMGTVIFATYVLGVLVALLGFGRWSDVVGRRPVLIASVACALLSTLLMLSSDLIHAWALPVLLLGRLSTGLSVGLFVGAGTVALIELAPDELAPKASFIATAANVTGLGFGPLLAGVMVALVPPPLQSVYWVLLACFAVGAVVIWFMPETVAVQPGSRPHMQRPSIPANMRGTFLQAAVPGFAGFAVLGLFGAVSPDLLGQMRVSNTIAQGLIIFVVFAVSGMTQLLVKPLPFARTMQAGCVLLALGAAVILLAVRLEAWLPLLAGGVISSVGWGATFAKGFAHVGERVESNDRAGVSSALFVCFYAGLTLPAVGVGAAALKWGLSASAITFAAVMIVISIGALLLNLRSLDRGNTPA